MTEYWFINFLLSLCKEQCLILHPNIFPLGLRKHLNTWKQGYGKF